MNDSVRELLRESADTVARPRLDVDQLVALADRRLVRRRMTAVAVSAVAVASIVVGATALGPDSASPSPAPSLPSETPTTEPTPDEPVSSPVARVPRVPSDTVQGWPTTSRNRAGAYSWDGQTCAQGNSCIRGFMHNGYGSGDVKITIERATGRPPQGWTPTTVAEHQGLYRQLYESQYAWWVEIDGTKLAIKMLTKPGTIKREIDEGLAIIGSMYIEKRDNALGWRLVFITTTNDWDSG
jgi:hypothetical protein